MANLIQDPGFESDGWQLFGGASVASAAPWQGASHLVLDGTPAFAGVLVPDVAPGLYRVRGRVLAKSGTGVVGMDVIGADTVLRMSADGMTTVDGTATQQTPPTMYRALQGTFKLQAETDLQLVIANDALGGPGTWYVDFIELALDSEFTEAGMPYIDAAEFKVHTGKDEALALPHRLERASDLLDARVGNIAMQDLVNFRKYDLAKLPDAVADAIRAWVANAVLFLATHDDKFPSNESIRIGKFAVNASKGGENAKFYAQMAVIDSRLVSLGLVERSGRPTNTGYRSELLDG